METQRSNVVDGYEARMEIHHSGKVYVEAWHDGRFVSREQVLPEAYRDGNMLHTWIHIGVCLGPATDLPHDTGEE